METEKKSRSLASLGMTRSTFSAACEAWSTEDYFSFDALPVFFCSFVFVEEPLDSDFSDLSDFSDFSDFSLLSDLPESPPEVFLP
ncbi:MAG TPA: hypothetical protein VHS29_06950 [Candidatus Acidoferrales bacterium]|nr:hypothetical protein [Candidatus Acidoferrales bacterium]